MLDLDVSEYSRGTQVTFELHGIDVLGEVKSYLGEGEYVIEDENGDTHELLNGSFTVIDED